MQSGLDIKVYAVGYDYQHAEARKSPVIDGKVERLPSGREARKIVSLSGIFILTFLSCFMMVSAAEREIAQKVARAFQQGICGFDLLRCEDHSLVCDVNGWSFVKGHQQFYDRCVEELITMMKRGASYWD